MLRFISSRGVVSSRELDAVIPCLTSLGFARLLWYLGLDVIVRTRGGYRIRFSSCGMRIVRELANSGNPRDVVRKVFVKCYLLLVFLNYIGSRYSVTVNDIVREPSGLMKKWTRILYDLGITKSIMRRRSIPKPFNSFLLPGNSLYH